MNPKQASAAKTGSQSVTDLHRRPGDREGVEAGEAGGMADQRRHQFVTGVLQLQPLDLAQLPPRVATAAAQVARQPRAAHLSAAILDHVDGRGRRMRGGDGRAERRRLALVSGRCMRRTRQYKKRKVR